MPNEQLLIQNQESPHLTITLFPLVHFTQNLHIFGDFSYFLSGSGLEQILIGTGVVTSGSMKGILKGKYYNRCKRIYVLLFLALECCHFKSRFGIM